MTFEAPTQLLAAGARRTAIELKRYVREPLTVVLIFIYPIGMFALFSSIYGTMGDQGVFDRLPDGTALTAGVFLLPGMMATGLVLSSFQCVGTWVAEDRVSGMLKRLSGTPMPRGAYFLGLMGQALIGAVIQVTLLLVIAATAFDVPLPASPGRWVTLAWVFGLSVLTGTVLGAGVGGVFGSAGAANGVLVPLVLVLQFISGVFFEFASLSASMQHVAAVFPLKWMAQGLRSVFYPESAAALEMAGGWEPGRIVLVLVAWLLAGLVAARLTFRWLPPGEK
jgi:ABC-2 type transport system permease protein